RALADALDITLKLTLSIPLSNIMEFQKLTHSYFSLLKVLCNSHTNVIVNLATRTFAHIVGSLESGLKILDVNISTQCASVVDNLASFYFNNIIVGETSALPSTVNLARHIAECPNLFPK
ncbi:hypothetical protein KI387_012498, partial [Taxus chinensis]